MKIFISGHRGFIGRHLNEHLNKEHEVFGADLKDGLDVADITNLDSFRGVDVVIHLAAHLKYPKKNTIEACHGIMEFCKREKAHLIYASSAAVYNPTSMYAVHKLYGETLFREGLSEWTVLRLFNVYGPGGQGIVDKIKNGEHLQIHGSGEQRRDYVHVNDVCESFSTVLNTDIKGTYDIGSGDNHSVNRLLEMAGHTNYDRVVYDPGVANSVARLNNNFPWHARETVQTYLAEASQ